MKLCFFFNDTATTEIYTLSLHDALPVSHEMATHVGSARAEVLRLLEEGWDALIVRSQTRVDAELLDAGAPRSEEHTSELQSRQYLVCRLLLEKKITTTLSRKKLP